MALFFWLAEISDTDSPNLKNAKKHTIAYFFAILDVFL